MKQILFTVIGAFLLFTGTSATGNHVKKNVTAIVKPAVAGSCNFTTLRGHRKGNGTSITWSADGVGISKFNVYRSYDFDPSDPYAVWESVTSMAANNSRSYKVDDNSVFPGTINYKIVAVMNDGSTATSDFIAVRIMKK
jgi:hypothetical protein